MKLIVIEDEKDVAAAICRGLKKNGYSVDAALDGQSAVDMLGVNEYDLMILDLNLPDLDGLEVCRLVRSQHPALLILILSARNRLEDVVRGLDLGADDYLTKPFHLEEILARIRALLRRDIRCRDPLLRFKDLCLDPAEHVAWKHNHRLELTRKEFSILEFFLRHPGDVISQEMLLEHAWGSNMNYFSNTVRVHIQSLRRKLEEDANTPEYIETVVGAGYRLIHPEQPEE